MNSSDASTLSGQSTSLQQEWMRQRGTEKTSEQKGEQSKDSVEVFEAWCSQLEPEEVKSRIPFEASDQQQGLSIHFQPSCRASDAIGSYAGYFGAHAMSQPPSQAISSQSSTSRLSGVSSSIEAFQDAPMAQTQGRKTRRSLKAPYPSTAGVRDSISPSPLEAPAAGRHDAELNDSDPNRSGLYSEEPRGPRTPSNEVGLLKDIYDTTQCFWLVSENRMAVMQEELKVIKARIEDSVSKQAHVGWQVSQILPLQVEITQKVIGAAEERKIIFGRIKALEESTAMWQQEVKVMLEAMRADFRAGVEMMLEIAPKARKQQIQRNIDEAAAASVKGSNKRAGTPSKKSNVPKAKKGKTQAGESDDCVPKTSPLSLSSSSPPMKTDPALIQDWNQPARSNNEQPLTGDIRMDSDKLPLETSVLAERQHLGNDWHHLRSSQLNSHLHLRPRPQSATFAVQEPETQTRPHTSASQHAPYEHLKPQYHPQPTRPHVHDIQQGFGSLDVALRE
ncbi:uncharacterized protein UTRI_06126 [Ustilago trichophora]|uniref:Uncharacterized protein n=1 Tax=Ustilago trichophora TaxID=86804 RepID=A0A5C3EHH5_9BASI|nr:uncharacterized protein UTRI_06126 [Ustilago trichophora]